MLRRRYALVVPIVAALAVAGCGDSNNKVSSKPSEPTQKGGMGEGGTMEAHTGARVALKSPKGGAVVTGTSVPTDVSLSDFRVDCRFAGTPDKPGVGHYHIELDGSLVNMFCHDRASVSMQNVAPGSHTLAFIPAANDHADDLKAEKKVSFVYRPSTPLAPIKAESKGKPSIRILSPKPGSTVRGSFLLTVAPKNFEFSCALYGKKNVPGYGHWHANVDSTSKGMMGMGTMLGMSCARSFRVSLAGIKPGQHTFFAILEDNQHAPTPKAQASVKLNVR